MRAHLRGMTRRRWVAVVLVLAVLAAGGGYWLSRTGTSSSAAATPTYRTVAAALGTIRESISASGTVAPAQQESLNFPVSGKVTAVDVAAGDAVKAGQVLATVDSAQAQATLAQAKAALADAQARLDSDTTAAATSTQLAADQSAVTAAQGQVTSAQDSLSSASMTSPINGVVASVALTVGQQVSGGSGSGNGGSGNGSSNASNSSNSSNSSASAEILVISTNSWLVNTSVDDTQIGLLAKGDQAQIAIGSSTTPVYGTVTSVGMIATSSSGVASYPVVVTVTGSPSGLHSGATATVTLIYHQLTDVLTVPTAAVHLGNGQPYVLQSKNGKQVSTPVTIGLASGGQTQIVAGLAEGDQVLVPVIRGARTGSTRTGTNTGGTGFPGGGTFQLPGGGQGFIAPAGGFGGPGG